MEGARGWLREETERVFNGRKGEGVDQAEGVMAGVRGTIEEQQLRV